MTCNFRHLMGLHHPVSVLVHVRRYIYGVASVSRIDKIIGLFAKEPYTRDDILQKRPII